MRKPTPEQERSSRWREFYVGKYGEDRYNMLKLIMQKFGKVDRDLTRLQLEELIRVLNATRTVA